MSAAIDLAVRAAIVLSLAGLSVLLLRRRGAAERALVWTLALAGILVLPVLSHVTPSWTLVVWQRPAVVEYVAPVLASVPEVARVDEESSSAAAPAPIAFSEASAVTLPQPEPAAPAAPINWNAVALFAWALLTGVLLARILASHARMNALLADAGAADAGWSTLIDEVKIARGIRRAVDVRTTDAVSVPAIVGVVFPTLLLPGDADEWDQPTRRAVVLHELAHVARWDALAQLVGQIACAVYWFLPLAWHAARRASALRERASDDEVLRAGVRASTYAERLLNLARGAGSADMQLATVAMARPSRMRERVVAILDPAARRDALTARAIVAALILSSGAITAVAAAAPAVSEIVNTGASVPSSGQTPQVVARPNPAAASTSLVRHVTPAPAAQPTPDVEPTPADQPAPIAEPAPATDPLPPAAQGLAQFCDGSHESVTNSNTDENGRRKWTIKLKGPSCTVDMRAEGRIEFNDDFTDIRSIGSGGFFRLDVTDGSTRRQLEIESRNGSLARSWRVDGRVLPYDGAARSWFAAFLIELDRRTGIGAPVRVPHLLKQGGVSAVLNETGLMQNDYVRGEYYRRLSQATRLSSADVTRVLEQAATLTRSDHYGTELIKSFGGQNINDAPTRAAMARMIDKMSSDHYRAESISVLAGSGRMGAAELDFILRMIPRIKSDHYAVEVLNRVVGAGGLTPDQQASLARAAASVEGDHYATEFLKRIVGAGTMPPPARAAYIEAVRGIQGDHYASEALRAFIRGQQPAAADVEAMLRLVPGVRSDHYRAEVLYALIGVSTLSERDLLGIVESARPMSDHYESETLRRLVLHRAFTDRVRDAVVSAAESMSRHYGDEVRRAAVRAR